MTRPETEALIAALMSSEALPLPNNPVPTPAEFAERIEHELAARGYEIVRRRSSRGDALPSDGQGWPCRCPRGCLAHPFGQPREMSP